MCSPGVVSAGLVLDRQGELERGQSLWSPGVVSTRPVVLERDQSLWSPGVVLVRLVVLERGQSLCSPGVVSARLVVLERGSEFVVTRCCVSQTCGVGKGFRVCGHQVLCQSWLYKALYTGFVGKVCLLHS